MTEKGRQSSLSPQAGLCEIHQLHFDPWQPGCPFCLRPLESSKKRASPVVLASVVSLAIAASALWLLAPFDSGIQLEATVRQDHPREWEGIEAAEHLLGEASKHLAGIEH